MKGDDFLIIKNLIIKYKKYFIIGGFLLLIVASLVFKNNNMTSNPVIVDALESDSPKDNIDLETYAVDIKGAVKNPGVYKMVKGSNVLDAIEAAGGLKKDATTININLSKKIIDEMVIYIYTKSEYNKLNSKQSNNTPMVVTECKTATTSADISSCIKDEPPTIITSNSDNTSSNNNENNTQTDDNNSNQLVNINTATKDELMTITGIGESKANCIISYRIEVGLFKTIEEIKNVSGIGEALFAKIKDQITV